MERLCTGEKQDYHTDEIFHMMEFTGDRHYSESQFIIVQVLVFTSTCIYTGYV